MRSRAFQWAVAAGIAALLILCGCGTIPIKQYFVLNYVPSMAAERLMQGPYPYTVRLKEFDIEEAYNRPQIVYRQSPYELRYYVYRVWAVNPTRMITDLVQKHLIATELVSSVVRRFDAKPDYELGGTIEAIEEYDSQDLWFAHLAIRFAMTRVSDGKTVYFRRFDLRKRVYQHEPEFVIKEMSSLMEFIMMQVIHDLDQKLGKEFGLAAATTMKSAADSAATIVRDTSGIEGATSK